MVTAPAPTAAALAGEAPPLYGEDQEEIMTVEDATRDEYGEVVGARTALRRDRERVEDERILGGAGAAANTEEVKKDVKLNYVQPRKGKRFKVYFKYEGGKWVVSGGRVGISGSCGGDVSCGF